MDYKVKTKDEAYDFLVRAGVIRPNDRTLEGQEKEEVQMILNLLTPLYSTNNQRYITEYYEYGEFAYSVTFFKDDCDIIEITKDPNA